MSRRRLRGIHTTMARKGVNAASWFAGQSFNSGTRGDMPLTQMTDKRLNQAGAGLLPARDDEPARCAYCGEVDGGDHDAARCAINAERS